jgi:hypothetical protein
MAALDEPYRIHDSLIVHIKRQARPSACVLLGVHNLHRYAKRIQASFDQLLNSGLREERPVGVYLGAQPLTVRMADGVKNPRIEQRFTQYVKAHGIRDVISGDILDALLEKGEIHVLHLPFGNVHRAEITPEVAIVGDFKVDLDRFVFSATHFPHPSMASGNRIPAS